MIKITINIQAGGIKLKKPLINKGEFKDRDEKNHLCLLFFKQ